MAEACERLRQIYWDKLQWLASMEMCYLEEKVRHLCVDTCINSDPAQACFNQENPPSCEEGDNDNGMEWITTYNAEQYCYILYRFQLWRDIIEHVDLLVPIHKDLELLQSHPASLSSMLLVCTQQN